MCNPEYYPADESDGEPNEDSRPYYESGWRTWRIFCDYLRHTLSFDFNGEEGDGVYINSDNCKKIANELKVQLVHYMTKPKKEKGIYSPDGQVNYTYVSDVARFCEFCDQCSNLCYNGFYID